MKNKIVLVSIVLLLVLSILACGTVAVVPTATTRPPNSPIPPTNTPVPTFTSVPSPIPPTNTPPPPSTGTETRQWAISAFASSEYSSPSWSAAQTVGAPDTPDCGDYTTAWASENYNGVDWLELVYAIPVIPTRINIHENYNPDFVVAVEVIDINGNYLPVYSATGGIVSQCPYILSIPVTGITSYVYGVRLTIDQSVSLSWNEIDAVELIGTSDASAPPAPVSTIPAVSGDCESPAVQIDMNVNIDLAVSAGTYPDACNFYCLWVPDNGTSLEIGISDFDVDLDLYVDTNISVLAFEDHGQWESNAYGTGDEAVSIFNPGGRYYIQVCSYEGLASPFTLTSLFVP